MATGALDANGIWQYGEDDSNTTFSALLNRLGSSTSTQIGALKTRGKVKQIVTATTTTLTTTTSTTFVTANLSASITPSATSSKILAIVTMNGRISQSNSAIYTTLFRGTVAGTNLGYLNNGFGFMYTASGGITQGHLPISFIDSPGTTSSTTYTVGFRADSTATATVNYGVSTLTLIEVLA